MPEKFDYRIEMYHLTNDGHIHKIGYLEFNHKGDKYYLNSPMNVSTEGFIIECLKPIIDKWVEDWKEKH